MNWHGPVHQQQLGPAVILRVQHATAVVLQEVTHTEVTMLDAGMNPVCRSLFKTSKGGITQAHKAARRWLHTKVPPTKCRFFRSYMAFTSPVRDY